MKTRSRKLVALALALAMLLTIMPASVFAVPDVPEAGQEAAIIVQPQDVSIASGGTAEFAVEAVGDGLTYRWQYATKTGEAWYNAISAVGGYTASTMKMAATAGRNGYKYRCVVADQYGNEVISDAAILLVA